eukprot:10547030-Lingulodinium_polyedra.AAC.1
MRAVHAAAAELAQNGEGVLIADLIRKLRGGVMDEDDVLLCVENWAAVGGWVQRSGRLLPVP